MKTTIISCAKTHVGRIREHNEDSFIVGLEPDKFEWVLNSDEFVIGDKGSVFVVADGMGGESAGEIASEIAVQSIRAFIHTELNKEEVQPFEKILESALVFAHNKIKDACRNNADYIGMGTTATICLLTSEKIYISWVGDSRVYRYSSEGRIHALPYFFKNLDILTEDHSKVWQMVKQGQIDLEQARTHPESNIITQSLGDIFRTPVPEFREYPLFKNDIFLLCTDGLNGMLSDEQIEKILSSPDEALDKMAEKLVSAANEAGGNDNITIILCKVVDSAPYDSEVMKKTLGTTTLKTEATSRRPMRRTLLTLLLLIAISSISAYLVSMFNGLIPDFSLRKLLPAKDTIVMNKDSVTNATGQDVPPASDTVHAVEKDEKTGLKNDTNGKKQLTQKDSFSIPKTPQAETIADTTSIKNKGESSGNKNTKRDTARKN